MYDGNPGFSAHDRARRSRVDVTYDDDPVGPLPRNHPLVGHHDTASLLGVAPTPNLEMRIRLWHA